MVDLIGIFHSVVALGHHIHLHKGASNGITLTYHATKEAVTAKSRIPRNEQIAQVGRLVDVAGDGVNSVHIALHLADSIAHQYTLEVVPIAQTMGDPCGDGIDVLEHSPILHSYDVLTDFGTDKGAA